MYIYVHIHNYIIIQYIYYTNHWGWSIQRIDGGFGGFLQMDDASRLLTRVARSTSELGAWMDLLLRNFE